MPNLPPTGNEHPEDPSDLQQGPARGTPVQPEGSDELHALLASIARRLDDLGEHAFARAIEVAVAPGPGDFAAANSRIRAVLSDLAEACRSRLNEEICADVARCVAMMGRVLEPAR
ncbi:MAG: hypothetical protein ACOZNI_37110 [Myxococcota bacterium]